MGEAYLAVDSRLGRKVALKVLPAELASNQDRMRRFTQEAKVGYLDMLDERTLLYADTSADVSNIWSRAVEGGAAKQLTRFTSEQIVRYASSHDGKRFAMARGIGTADIVLIKGFRLVAASKPSPSRTPKYFSCA